MIRSKSALLWKTYYFLQSRWRVCFCESVHTRWCGARKLCRPQKADMANRSTSRDVCEERISGDTECIGLRSLRQKRHRMGLQDTPIWWHRSGEVDGERAQCR